MTDMHVHLERGPYTKEWLNEFIAAARERGITTLGVLEHSHRFIEFKNVFSSIGEDPSSGEYQKEWLNREYWLYGLAYRSAGNWQ